MTNFEQILLQAVAALPPARRADVLAFVRFLRISLLDEAELEIRYDFTVAAIRETARRYNITDKGVEEEIRTACRMDRRPILRALRLRKFGG